MRSLTAIAALALALPAAAQEVEPPTPASVVAAASPEEWRAIDPADMLVMTLAPAADGSPREVVIQLMPAPFSQPWVDNIRTLASAHWWDGKAVYRVVDNWVAQWGAGEDEQGKTVPLPERVVAPMASYDLSPSKAVDFRASPQAATATDEAPVLTNSPYAQVERFYSGWPIAGGDGTYWPVHCYASVGVARDLAPDTGTGAELYAVIGHAPRQLDRNIAVVGRVIEGIEHLSVLPRGTGEYGVYETRQEDTPILGVRLASELSDPPAFQYLSTDSESFAHYVHVRANRHDAFYEIPAGGVDICNVQVPIRRTPDPTTDPG